MLGHPSMTLASAVHSRCAVLCAVVLAWLLAAPLARAQTVGIVGSVVRYEPNGSNADATGGNPHPGGVPENIINYEDCNADLSYEFELSIQGGSKYNLVAWVGPDDCTAAAAREGSTATCWPVTAAAIPQKTGPANDAGPTATADDAGVPTTTVKIRVQDIAAQAELATGTPVSPTYTPGGAQGGVCTPQAPVFGPVPLTIYFFFTDDVAPGDAIGVAQAYPVIVDTVAQSVGTCGFTVEENLDTQLTVSVSVAPDSDTTTFNVYCDPPPGEEGTITLQPTTNTECAPTTTPEGGTVDSATDAHSAADAPSEADALAPTDASDVDAGSASDAASAIDSAPSPPPVDDAGGSPSGVPKNDAAVPISNPGTSCVGETVLLQPDGGTTTTSFVPTDEAGADGGPVYIETSTTVGVPMTLGIPAGYLVATVAASSATYTITGLKDGVFYTIAVAAVDNAGNVGPLATSCQESVQFADFWYNYTAGGGRAGGGYCSAAEGAGVPAGTGGLGLLMIASFVALVRKRRRRSFR